MPSSVESSSNANTMPMSVDPLGHSRKSMFDSVDACLERLGMGYIDILRIHRLDSNVDVKEVMRALHDVIQTWKVRCK